MATWMGEDVPGNAELTSAKACHHDQTLSTAKARAREVEQEGRAFLEPTAACNSSSARRAAGDIYADEQHAALASAAVLDRFDLCSHARLQAVGILPAPIHFARLEVGLLPFVPPVGPCLHPVRRDHLVAFCIRPSIPAERKGPREPVGGKDHRTTDREDAEKVLAVALKPAAPTATSCAAVTYLAKGGGVTQFPDISACVNRPDDPRSRADAKRPD
jgi:hypothetical protein